VNSTSPDISANQCLYITGKGGSFVSFLIAHLRKKVLVLYEDEESAELLREEISYYGSTDVAFFPPYEDRFFEEEDNVKRTGFLYRITEEERFIGLFPAAAIMRGLPAPLSMSADALKLTIGQVIFLEDIHQFLEAKGFELAPLVREAGQYAKRGSIIDIFPPASEKPVRCEFIGDQVLSLRYFNPATQRSDKEIAEIAISSLKRQDTEDSATIIDYLDEGTILAHPGSACIEAALTDAGPEISLQWSEFLKRSGQIDFSGILGTGNDEEAIRAVSNDDLRQIFNAQKTHIFHILREKLQKEWSHYPFVYLFAHTAHQARRLQEIFENYGLVLPYLTKIGYPKKTREWGIIEGPIRRGFRTDTVIVLTEDDIAGPKKRVVRKKWESQDEFLATFRDLDTGERVVHVDHGIGIYRGITALTVNNYTKDFLLIEYLGGDKLYVPVEDLHLVQKFIGSEKFKPKIDRLGSKLWINTKKRVKSQIEDIAGELLEIYAERQMSEGHSYPPEDELFREMESRFDYEETEGQINAINDVLADLRRPKPMDRLICGDVGFGKTEVALRAAFKAVLDGKQVAVLVPTTVLAQQHYKTFSERFADYPIVIGVLSRFRTRQQQAETVELLKKGLIDVIVGTHRLLQKDVSFHDLGLVVVDEEHRFGVKHKERLKILRKTVDVLTMSATPIPRTLYMATSGIRDLSVIDTPPLDRQAVRTTVVKFNDNVVMRGIHNELERSGQVFFVHNFVHNINVIYDHLARIVPDARIAVAHGQMSGPKLEKIMIDFIEKKYDILLSTNIIESGLDISNVNTIFINNAHRMGLAELYQLRGRVGRSPRQAYAYLLVPDEEALTRDARLRLKILEELSDLGSGFQIANYDLEIRGAGNLVGKEQSGSVNLIGFELYCDMLEDTIDKLKNAGSDITPVEEVATEINIPVNAFIPDNYIEDPTQKLLMYKRLSRVRHEDELGDLKEELKDRYGPMPDPLVNLLEVIALKSLLMRLKIAKVEQVKSRIALHVTANIPLDMQRLLGMATDPGKNVKLLPGGQIVINTNLREGELMNFIRNILMELIAL
jgi:transcription-repair coupling factor (superfamily II helicase)